MNVIDTPFEGLKIIEPVVFGDDRGYFFESYNEEKFHQHGIINRFIQDNESYSEYGVVRGLHYQLNPMAQAKLVRVVLGEVKDIVVDIRPDSLTYGKSYGICLSQENKRQLLIPKGFAHGYSVQSEEALFVYKCDNLYSKENERGIYCLDDSLILDWGIPIHKMKLSEKDKEQPKFQDHSKFV